MIKCNVTINGVISRAATIRTNKEGKSFVGFGILVNLTAGSEHKQIEVSVLKEGSENELSQYNAGLQVELQGSLTFKKRENHFYLNFYADSVNFEPENNSNTVIGSMEFKGTIGKQVEEKTDKKGRKYIVFSAFSTEKTGDNFEFIWVRFVRFSPERETFLIPKGRVHVKGAFDISFYQDRLILNCRVEEIGEWVKVDYRKSNEETSL